MKATKKQTIAIFDLMEQNLLLVENLLRETRAMSDQARRMIGIETKTPAGTHSESDHTPRCGPPE